MWELCLRPFTLAMREGSARGVVSCFHYIGHTWAGGRPGPGPPTRDGVLAAKFRQTYLVHGSADEGITGDIRCAIANQNTPWRSV